MERLFQKRSSSLELTRLNSQNTQQDSVLNKSQILPFTNAESYQKYITKPDSVFGQGIILKKLQTERKYTISQNPEQATKSLSISQLLTPLKLNLKKQFHDKCESLRPQTDMQSVWRYSSTKLIKDYSPKQYNFKDDLEARIQKAKLAIKSITTISDQTAIMKPIQKQQSSEIVTSEAYNSFKKRFRKSNGQTIVNQNSVECVQKGKFDRLSDDQFWNYLARYYSLKRQQFSVQKLLQGSLYIDLQPEPEQFFVKMYFKEEVQFLNRYDLQTINRLCNCFKLVQFESNHIIFNKDDEADSFYVVISGSVGVYSDSSGQNPLEVILKAKSVFGETSILGRTKRHKTVVAMESPTYCVVISKDDFLDNVSYYEYQLKEQRFSFVLNHPLIMNWPYNKIQEFNSCCAELHQAQGNLIYDVGSSPLSFYIVKSGTVTAEAFINLEDEYQYPASANSWETFTKTRKILFKMKKLYQGDIFGQQELVDHLNDPKGKHVRKYRVVADTKAVLIYLNGDQLNKCKQGFFNQAVLVFEKDKLNEFKMSGYLYDEKDAIFQLKQILENQKAINRTLNQSALSNLNNSDVCNSFANQISEFKLRKQIAWIRGSGGAFGTKKKFNNFNNIEFEKIKLLKTTSSRKQGKKSHEGQFLTTQNINYSIPVIKAQKR